MPRERMDGYMTALGHAFKTAGLSSGETVAPAANSFPETLPAAVRAIRPAQKPMGISRA